MLSWTQWFVTDEVRALGPTATTRAMALVLACPVLIVVTVAPALAQLIDGQPTPIDPALGLSVCTMFVLGPLILRWTKSPTLAGAWTLFAALVATSFVVYMQQGLTSILMVWFLAIPATASFFLGARWSVVFSILSALCISGFWALESLPWPGYDPSLAHPEGDPFRWINLLAALVTISTLGMFWERAAERSQRERDELEAQARHSQKLQTVGKLAGGIAHDFNNILAAILGHASMLEAELPDSPAKRRVRAIVDSSQRAAMLVEQMLAYAGRARTHTGIIDLPQLVGEIVELLGPALGKNTELILDLDRPTPQLAGDPVQIQQVAMNLIMNASESLEGQRGRVWVRVAAIDHSGVELDRPASPEDFVMLEVRDEGCGIPPEQIATIFDPFYTTKPNGHGLGLAAVHGIVDSHGGDIEVESTVGRGTRVRVSLRCPDPETLASAEQDDAPRPRVRVPTTTNLAQLPGPKRSVTPRTRRGPGHVLIVDDEQMVRELAGEVLEGAGHRVLLASDGDDGLAVFEAHEPNIDLVILDRTMPGLDGLELLAEMRRRRPDIPAIISSGYAEDDGSRRLQALGIDAVLQKPWAPRDLVQLVSELAVSAQAAQSEPPPPPTPRASANSQS
ncbi:Wide host range VirA protein [Enhygromyxa salina]|uniref:histidine kinase n=1 Tax=Enhygromyxa salina TaxID=215803 RepID=A0A2S9YEB5_9BACT|nr:ATP-binding protein [Enhygromyxa salina]PRQ03382.1 Wide host range VirA protein [Enhygromyxa salina]